MTTGHILSGLSAKTWSGANGKGNENFYSMNAATISTSRYGDKPEDFYIQDIITPEGIFDSETKVRNKCIMDLREYAQSVDTYAFLKDVPSTVALATTRLRQAYKLVKALKKGDVKNIKRSFDGTGMHSVPAAWLELNFVIKPTMGDLRTLANILNQPPPIQEIRVFAKDSGYSFDNEHTPIYTYYKWDVLREYRLGVVGINPNIALAEKLGLANAIGTAWEIAPWSWAIDYFANVGDILGNFTPRYIGWEFAYIATTCKRRLQRSFARYDHSIYPDWGRIESDATHMWRAPLGTPPDNIELEVGFNLKLQQASYLASAVALTLRGKFKG